MIFETNGLKALYFQADESQAVSTRGQPDVNLHRLTRVTSSSQVWRKLRMISNPLCWQMVSLCSRPRAAMPWRIDGRDGRARRTPVRGEKKVFFFGGDSLDNTFSLSLFCRLSTPQHSSTQAPVDDAARVSDKKANKLSLKLQ